MTTPESVRDAYSLTGAAWDEGPRKIYRRLADVIVELVPNGVADRALLDVGAGTGVVGESAIEHGAAGVVALDASLGILQVGDARRPAAVVGDAIRLPFADSSFDVVIAGFSFNHVDDPAAAFGEAARILRDGGGLCVAVYASHDTHPVKRVVEDACRARGWSRPAWYVDLQRDAVPLLATPSDALRHTEPLTGARAGVVDVPFHDLDRAQLVAWRLGMAHIAPFVASLSSAERDELVADASRDLPSDMPPLVRSIVAVTWTKGR